jgi:hypothetical protein
LVEFTFFVDPSISTERKIFALFQQLAEFLTDQESPDVLASRPAPERALLTVEEAAEHLHIGRTRMFDLVIGQRLGFGVEG